MYKSRVMRDMGHFILSHDSPGTKSEPHQVGVEVMREVRDGSIRISIFDVFD